MQNADMTPSSTLLVIKEEIREALMQHNKDCPFNSLLIEGRVRLVETRFSLLLGFMAGSGLLGGATGGLLIKLLGG